jgi:hypothetical protein
MQQRYTQSSHSTSGDGRTLTSKTHRKPHKHSRNRRFKPISARPCQQSPAKNHTTLKFNKFLGGTYAGPYSDPQFVTGLLADREEFYINPLGDFAFVDGLDESLYVVYDLTSHSTPEPSSLLLLTTGIVGLAGLARRKLLRP